jgi:hypothetical protein
MKADWDKLGAKYASSESVMIVDVDCTADNAKATCGQQQVKGYPTVKYFMAEDPGKAKDYQQGRDFNSLAAFVASKLDVAQCDPLTGKYCKENQLAFIETMKIKTKAELVAERATRDATFKDAKAAHKEAGKAWRKAERDYKKLQKRYKKAEGILKILVTNAPEAEAGAEGKAEL